MTTHTAVLVTMGVLAWLGLALCVAVAIGLTIREADRRPRPTAPVDEQSTSAAAPVHLEVYREWVRDGDPSGIRPPATPPRFEAWL